MQRIGFYTTETDVPPLYFLEHKMKKGLGKHQKKMLAFAQKYPGWHTFATDVKRIALSLQKSNLIEINEFGQFRCTISSLYTRYN